MTDIEKLTPVDVKKQEREDVALWSVTTILGALDKPGLLYWTGEQAALAAVRQQATWRGMLEDEGDTCDHGSARYCGAVKWLRDARFRRAPGEKSAAELGTEVHAAAEEYVITGRRPDVSEDVEPFLRQFEAWCERVQPAYQAAEVTVYNPTYGYAGTADAFLTIQGQRLAGDYKTSQEPTDSKGNPKTPYPEVALQLAAYVGAEFAAAWRPRRFEKWRRRYYLLSEAERAAAVPVPEVDAGLAILITPEYCHGYVVDVGPTTFTSFLYVQEAFRWQQETSRTVIASKPLEVL